MRILLDECVPKDVRDSFRDYDCQTAPQAGFAGRKNGALLTLAEAAAFDVLVSVDRGLFHQQNVSDRKIAVVIIHTRSNKLADLMPHVPECLLALRSIQPGQVVRVGIP